MTSAHTCTDRCALPSGECVEAWIDAHHGGASLEEIAGEWGLTRERIRQIEAAALGKLRRALERLEADEERRPARVAPPASSAPEPTTAR